MILFTCVLFYLAATVLAADPWPKVNITETNPAKDPVSQKIVAEKYSDVQLTCVVENIPNRYVRWTKAVTTNGNKTFLVLSSSNRTFDDLKYSIDLPSNTSWRLTIHNAEATDEGLYTCHVQASNYSFFTDSETLVIGDTPQIDYFETSSDVSKSEGDRLILRCRANGRPSPMVTWSRVDDELLPSGDREYVGSELVIPLLKPEHAGTYTCYANNSVGSDHRNIMVTVYFAPRLSQSRAVVKQAVGYVQQLVCDVTGYPMPEESDVIWTREGSTLFPDGHVYTETFVGWNRITSILVFWGAREEDYGEYTCSAHNQKGVGTLQFQLKRSSEPLEDLSGSIRAGASVLAVNVGSIIAVMSVCLVQRFA